MHISVYCEIWNKRTMEKVLPFILKKKNSRFFTDKQETHITSFFIRKKKSLQKINLGNVEFKNYEDN